VESFILQNTGQLFTDPKQTQQKKALFVEVRDEMKKESFDHIRVIGTDVVKEKAKSILYELDFQIQQTRQATAKLKDRIKPTGSLKNTINRSTPTICTIKGTGNWL
jgi:hypothetical protein